MLNRISIKTKSNVILILFLPVILSIAFYIYSLLTGPTYKSEITINLNIYDINNNYIRKIEPQFNDKSEFKKIFFNKVFNEVNFNKSLDFFYPNKFSLNQKKIIYKDFYKNFIAMSLKDEKIHIFQIVINHSEEFDSLIFLENYIYNSFKLSVIDTINDRINFLKENIHLSKKILEYKNNSDLETDNYNPPIDAISPARLGEKYFSSDLIYLMNKKQILNLMAVLNSKLSLYENEVTKLNQANYILNQDIILNKNYSVIKTSSKILPVQGFVLGVILTILIITTKKFFFKKK